MDTNNKNKVLNCAYAIILFNFMKIATICSSMKGAKESNPLLNCQNIKKIVHVAKADQT